MALVLPRSATATAGMTEWRRTTLSGGTFKSVDFLTNTGGWVFEQVHPQYTVALIVVEKGTTAPVSFSGPYHSYGDFLLGRSSPVVAPKEEFATWTDDLLFPRLADQRSGEILRGMKGHPPFSASDGWEFRPVQGDINATSDRYLFETDMERYDLDVEILTGASFEIWNPSFGEPYGLADRGRMDAHLLSKAQAATRRGNSAFSGLQINGLEDLPVSRARIAFRDVTNSTNQRTAIFCLLPPGVALVNKAPYLLRRTGSEVDEACLLGIVCSIPFDWYARRWVELNLNFFILNPMPVPRPDKANPLRVRVVELAGSLAAVDDRYAEWAEVVGVSIGGLAGAERGEAIAELDALAGLLYGLSWDDMEHIFKTFHRGWDYSERLERVKVHFEKWESQT